MEIPRLQKRVNRATVLAVIVDSFKQLGYQEPKAEQIEAIFEFVSGRDAFVVLPTGSGKSLCYVALPLIFDKLNSLTSTTSNSLVVVLSPLLSLMSDQVKKYGDRGLKCAFIGDSEDQEEGIMKGRYQIVYASPEALLRATQWREMLKSCVYHDHLIGLVVDEAHCVNSW